MATHDHTHDHGLWTHDHRFLAHGHERAESRARLATIITAIFMVVEIAAGIVFGSMALLADGIHMATHVGALGLAAAAYWLARRHAQNERFTFGSGKFGDLAAFASAIVLGLAGVGVGIESFERLIAPTAVAYGNALLVAVLGLAVNLICALILGGAHEHGHEHGHDHAQDHTHEHDHNMRAAYVHVLTDALTSVLAILALAGGYYFGVSWLDPIVGVVGAVVILSWAYSLVRDAGMVLLDAEADPVRAYEIRRMIEGEMGATVADLHLWHLGPGHQGLIVSLVSGDQAVADRVKTELRKRYSGLSHVTIEVSICPECAAQ